MSQFDIQSLFEQAKAMQQKMSAAQAELGKKTVTGQSGGGMVTVTANGLLEVVSIRLDPLCVDNRDVKMLEDLVTAAANQALREARALAERELGSVSGLGSLLGGGTP
jgi:DNA-binding YbaB/EbfC family protein